MIYTMDKPNCYGHFNDFDDYCWYRCPHSCLCEFCTYGENCVDWLYDDWY